MYAGDISPPTALPCAKSRGQSEGLHGAGGYFSNDTIWVWVFSQKVQLGCNEGSRRVQPIKTYLCSLLANYYS